MAEQQEPKYNFNKDVMEAVANSEAGETISIGDGIVVANTAILAYRKAVSQAIVGAESMDEIMQIMREVLVVEDE